MTEKADRRRSPDVRSQEEANVLVLQYQPLLRSEVKRLRPFWEKRGLTWDDACQEAQIGLMSAARKWDSHREGGFYWFVVRGIFMALRRAVARGRLIHVPNNYYNSQAPQPFREQAKRVWYGTHTLNKGEQQSDDWLAAKPEQEPVDLQVDVALRCLDRRSRLIIRLRFWEGMILEEVAEALSITRERVRQIEGKALIKLHRRFRQLMPDIRQRLQEAV